MYFANIHTKCSLNYFFITLNENEYLSVCLKVTYLFSWTASIILKIYSYVLIII